MSEQPKKGFFGKLKDSLFKSQAAVGGRVEELVQATRTIDEDFYDELTDILIMADVGVSTTDELIEGLKKQVAAERTKDAARAHQILREMLKEIMRMPRPPLAWPMVMLIVGVNGVGKTTSIGKLALRFRDAQITVMLAAADTFRAAAAEQLTVWAERAGVPIIRHKEGADPAAVVYDGVASAKSRGANLLIVDTAGRLHNKKHLMDELAKIHRVIEREYPEATLRTFLVLDATTGQNGLAQAKQFTEVTGVEGIILTKLDGTAKGGIAVAVQKELGVPVLYVGVGEGIDDLQAFDADAFVDAIF